MKIHDDMRKPGTAALLSALFYSLALFGCSTTQIVQQQDQTLAEEVARQFKETLPDQLSEASIPGAAIAVVDDRNIIWEQAYGHVAGEDSRPVDVTTVFSIQSMTKSFTALAILMAVQDGLVGLDSPIKEYLPAFTVNSIYDEHPEDTITLRHLLTHRAGFTHEAPFGSNFDDRNDFTEHIKSIPTTWLRYPVGYRLSYSNLGVDLAGHILQVRSGMPFELYVKKKVLDPIGMTGSSLDMDAIERNMNRAIGHSDDRDSIPLRIPMIPSGGVYSNIRDMAKYLQFHINKGVVDGRRILRADLMEEMHKIQFAHPGQRSGYCLCLIREPISDSYNLYHSGAGYGFSSDMAMYPQKKLGVVFLANSADHNIGSWRLRSPIDELIVKHYGATPVDEPGTEEMTRLETDNPRVQGAIGHYGGEDGFVIEHESNVLGLRFSSGDFYELTFYDDAGELVGFFGKYSKLRFLPSFNGRPGSLLKIHRSLGNYAAFNIHDFNDAPADPPGPDKPHWSKYVGDYEPLRHSDPEDTVRVSVRNGYLYVSEDKCTEYEPGLFFTHDGEAFDLRSDPPTIANRRLRKRP
jgi:CubicO group peptidase (beta-lactamase class C family)